MNEPNRGRLWIDNVDSAAVGDINAERDPALICNKPVATGEFLVRRDAALWHPVGAARRPYLIDNCNLVSVNLLGGEQRPIAHADCATNFTMSRLKSL